MGVYQMLPEHGQGECAVYRQLHDTNDQHYYLYRFDICRPRNMEKILIFFLEIL